MWFSPKIKGFFDPVTIREDGEEEEEESCRDDVDDEEEDDDEDEEAEEEHLAPADSVPPPAYHTISTTIVSSPLHVSPPPLPASPTYPLGYRAAIIRLRAESPSTSHPLPPPSPIVLPYTKASVDMMRDTTPSTYIFASRLETPPSGTPPLLPIPLPTLSLPLLLLSTDYKVGVFEVTLPPRKRLYITLGPRFEVGESSSAPTARPTGEFWRDYGFVATVDDENRRDLERDVEDNRFVMTVKQDTDEIYGRLDDAQDDRSLMSVGNLTH
ncbi:hypothetical protein Tco_0579302 [Tanacetum coccineum]